MCWFWSVSWVLHLYFITKLWFLIHWLFVFLFVVSAHDLAIAKTVFNLRTYVWNIIHFSLFLSRSLNIHWLSIIIYWLGERICFSVCVCLIALHHPRRKNMIWLTNSHANLTLLPVLVIIIIICIWNQNCDLENNTKKNKTKTTPNANTFILAMT